MNGDRGDDWLREVLHSLERPAMPQDVADRIDAALAAVPAPRDGAHDSPAAGPAPLPPPPRRRRRSWAAGTVGVAAAVTVLVALNPYSSPDGTQGPSAPLASAPASASPSPLAAEVPDEPGAGPTAGAAVSQVMVASQTSYTRQALPQQAVEVAETAVVAAPLPTPSASPLPDSWQVVAAQPAASRQGAADCVTGLPDADLPLLFVDRAEFEGEPVLVVARRSGPEIEVYVLQASCTSEDPSILLRATVEAP